MSLSGKLASHMVHFQNTVSCFRFVCPAIWHANQTAAAAIEQKLEMMGELVVKSHREVFSQPHPNLLFLPVAFLTTQLTDSAIEEQSITAAIM